MFRRAVQAQRGMFKRAVKDERGMFRRAVQAQRGMFRRLYSRGLQCFKLNGNHTENDRYWQKNNFFLFCKMFENVQFFSHLHFKIAKSAIMTQKIFF